MTEYKTEEVKISFKFISSSIKDEEVNDLNRLINQRSGEGWELVTYTIMGGSGGDAGRGILVTFKKG